MSLSAIIITKNAEDTIERCIESVSCADEIIVVVDASSTDNTALAAKKLNANVYIESWKGYGPQKNIALTHANNDWVLFIDDDEELTLALAEEVMAITKTPIYNFYWIKVITVFLGKKLTHLYGHNPRLFKKSAGKWTDAHVHEQVKRNDTNNIIKLKDKQSGILNNFLLHHSHQNIRSYLKKMHHYTTLDAQEMARTNTHRSGRTIVPSYMTPFKLAFRQFVKLLFYRKGILDNWQGIVWCTLSAYYEYEMGKKYLKLV